MLSLRGSGAARGDPRVRRTGAGGGGWPILRADAAGRPEQLGFFGVEGGFWLLEVNPRPGATVYGLCLRSGRGGSQRRLRMSDVEDSLGCMRGSDDERSDMSVNQRSAALVARLIGDAEELRIGVGPANSPKH